MRLIIRAHVAWVCNQWRCWQDAEYWGLVRAAPPRLPLGERFCRHKFRFHRGARVEFAPINLPRAHRQYLLAWNAAGRRQMQKKNGDNEATGTPCATSIDFAIGRATCLVASNPKCGGGQRQAGNTDDHTTAAFFPASMSSLEPLQATFLPVDQPATLSGRAAAINWTDTLRDTSGIFHFMAAGAVIDNCKLCKTGGLVPSLQWCISRPQFLHCVVASAWIVSV